VVGQPENDELLKRIDTVFFAAGDERIRACGHFYCLLKSGKRLLLSSGKRTQNTLHKVVSFRIKAGKRTFQVCLSGLGTHRLHYHHQKKLLERVQNA